MIVKFISPIARMTGTLQKEYYFRMYKGKQIAQRCPSKWKDTQARKAARELFARTWGQRYAHKRG